MATMPPRTPSHRPPPSDPEHGRGHVSPLGGATVSGGGQILRGGGSSGPLIKKPLEAGREGEKPVIRYDQGKPIATAR
jgi:hypothetical protein